MGARCISAQAAWPPAEVKYLINQVFPDEVSRQSLREVYDSMMHGNYPAAKVHIAQLKSQHKNNTLFYAALLNYEAHILYNESKYDLSISLCDSALGIIKETNGFSIRALNTKAKALAALNHFDEADKTLGRAIETAEKTKDLYGLSTAYYISGSTYSDRGLYEKGNELANKSLRLKEELYDEAGIAACHSFIGLNQSHLGNYSEGISQLQTSIGIRERIQDKRGLANSYLNLYKLYYEMGEYDKALQSELKSLDICDDLKDMQCVSGRLTNIGQLYQNRGEYKLALEYHFRALAISKQINIKNRVAHVHENIARVYLNTNNLKDALAHIDTSISINQTIGDKEGQTSAMLVKATILLKDKRPGESLVYATGGLSNSEALHLPTLLKDAHEILSELYTVNGKPDKALYHYKKFISLRDSIYNIEKTKEITRKEMEYVFARKEAMEKLRQEETRLAAEQESRLQKRITGISWAAIIILLIILIIALRQYKLKTESQQSLAKAYNSLSEKNSELNDKNHTIEQKNQIIHLKNQEITDSIKYAYNIQTAMMPTESEFAGYFKDAFVLFKPKDIISGDFFWITEKEGKVIYVTADCTGHGVPGGFMSMLGVSFLSEIINEHSLTEPALILSRLRKKVISALKQKGISGENQDGMDMIICVLDRETMELNYAAANHHACVIRKTADGIVLTEHRGEKQPVGIFGTELKPFKQYSIALQPGDLVVTMSDGYADQFGGPRGKKFKYKPLEELLMKHSQESLAEQNRILNETFENWRGKLEQVDDVTVIGIRV
ncbi:MAG: SpoIIE family protein phosphatase [Bacteroidetes bacterium]|nr:SpoIIE family protein phosphatase [Bacteroidota bacterium]